MRQRITVAGAYAALAMACGSGTGGAIGPTDASGDGTAAADAPDDAGADGASDAGADTLVEAESGAPTWCDGLSPKPAFCDDFDRGAVGARWDAIVQTTGSSLAFDQAIFVSAPQSIAMRSKNANSGEVGSVLLRKTVLASPARAKLSFDFAGDPVPASGGPVWIATLDVSLNHLFTLYLRDDGTTPAPALVEQAPVVGQTRNTFALPATTGQFVRVEIDLDLSAQKADVRFGGTTVLSQIAIAGGAASEATVRIGALTNGPQPAYAARFDNLTLELQ